MYQNFRFEEIILALLVVLLWSKISYYKFFHGVLPSYKITANWEAVSLLYSNVLQNVCMGFLTDIYYIL